MRKVGRGDILGLEAYDARREQLRAVALEAKRKRRVHVGDALTFLFENAETVRYQVQEMMRAERLFREEEIRHELETYNELLGDEGELGCTLLIEITDEAERDRRLRAWIALPEHVYVTIAGGARVRARYDRRQVGEDRLSAVQYLKFDVGGQVPLAVGCDHPAITAETALTPEQRDALGADLAGG